MARDSDSINNVFRGWARAKLEGMHQCCVPGTLVRLVGWRIRALDRREKRFKRAKVAWQVDWLGNC